MLSFRRRLAGTSAVLSTLFLLAAPADAQPGPDRTPTLRAEAQRRAVRRGDEGRAVRELQRRLAGLGFAITADGDFGPTTERTTKAFQAMRGHTADGRVGRTTIAALDDAATHRTIRRGARGETVEELQRLLNNAGQRLAVDGDFGPATERAVRAYQQSKRGLSATGVADVETFARLRRRAARVDSLIDGIGGTTPPARPAPTRLATTSRPVASDSQAQAFAKALAWAHAANAAGRRTLIINFEGWLSFNRGFAERVYGYHRDLLAGRRVSPPRGASSYVAKVLIAPLLSRHARSVEVLLLPETSERGQTSVAEATARAFHQVMGPSLKLIVTGHSFGSSAALRLGNKLNRHGISISGMLTIDSRTPGSYRNFIRPRNVRRHFNDYRKGLFLPGYEIRGADNLRIRGVTHFSIVQHRTVRDHYRQLVER